MRDDIDLLIIGGGPAGLAAAQYGARAALKTALAEKNALGGQALFIHTLENYPGNIAGESGGALCEALAKQAADFGAELLLSPVVSLAKNGGVFEAATDEGRLFRARAVIIASGAGHRKLAVPGEAELTGAGVSYCASCDGAFFKNKKIFIAGGGDAACDEALFLSRLTGSLTVLVRRGVFRAQKALARRVLENPAIQVRFHTKVRRILGGGRVTALELEDAQSGEAWTEEAEALFICAGIVPDTALVRQSGLPVEWDEGGFIKTDERRATAVAGLFAAGDVRSSPFRQVVVAASDGAVAAHSAAEYIAGLGS
jgi:thioredoxin reductase (NADPH)